MMRDGMKEGEKVWEEERETKGRTGWVGVSEGEGERELNAAQLQTERWKTDRLMGRRSRCLCCGR